MRNRKSVREYGIALGPGGTGATKGTGATQGTGKHETVAVITEGQGSYSGVTVSRGGNERGVESKQLISDDRWTGNFVHREREQG